jgi:predicted RNA binding protein YcfA (HicA-like mRNA interferase family)
MGKLSVLAGKEVCKILSRHGFEEVRRRGSHVVMQRRSPAGTIPFRYPARTNSKSGRRSPSFDKAGS